MTHSVHPPHFAGTTRFTLPKDAVRFDEVSAAVRALSKQYRIPLLLEEDDILIRRQGQLFDHTGSATKPHELQARDKRTFTVQTLGTQGLRATQFDLGLLEKIQRWARAYGDSRDQQEQSNRLGDFFAERHAKHFPTSTEDLSALPKDRDTELGLGVFYRPMGGL